MYKDLQILVDHIVILLSDNMCRMILYEIDKVNLTLIWFTGSIFA